MRILYLDTLFFLNYGLDYLALYFAGRLMKLPCRQWRLLLAALPGAAFAAVAVLWLGESPWYYLGFVLIGALMVWLGFGKDAGRGRLLLCTVAQLGAAILLGGVISAFYHVLDGVITPKEQMPIGKGEWILLLAVLSGGVIKVAFAVLDRRGGGDRAHVTVAARKREDLAWAQSLGCDTVRLREGVTPRELAVGFDVIYNTVPHWLFGRDFLEMTGKDTFLIDLASVPGGVDVLAAKELGSNVLWATSLPGKYAPKSAGESIADCVKKILLEEVTE